MKIKSCSFYIFILSIIFLSCIFLSCSFQKKINHKNQQIGKVLMHGTNYPLSVDIDIYYNKERINSIKSDNNGLFKFSTKKKYRKKLTFIIPSNNDYDTIYNINGHSEIVFRCYEDDTVYITNTPLNDTIILTPTKCKLLIIPDSIPFREH
ncbi:MAG: hypothetical protein H3C31_13760 [Brumimicrobium sp.]|nr:hypothetical protein [Brumimicrobium sp.]